MERRALGYVTEPKEALVTWTGALTVLMRKWEMECEEEQPGRYE